MSNNYKKQMDDICKTNTLTADDILKAFDEKMGTSEAEQDDFTAYKERKQKRGPKSIAKIGSRVAAAAVACIVLTGATVGVGAVAGFGPFADLFNKAEDPITAGMAEEGYLFEVNQTKTDGKFSATVFGIAGEEENPRAAMKLVIDDEEFTSAHESIRVCVYSGISKENYENKRVDLFLEEADKTGDDSILMGTYMFDEIVAKRDADETNAYYFSVPAGWYAQGDMVIAVRSIRYDFDSEGTFKEDMTDLRFDITIPSDFLKETYSDGYGDEHTFIGQADTEYIIRFFSANAYETSLVVQVKDENYPHEASEDMTMQENWNETAQNLKLIVDGNEYSVNWNSDNETYGYFFCSHQGDTGVEGYSVINLSFERFDFESAESVELQYNGTAVLVVK